MRIIISEKGEVTSSPVTVTHTSYTDDSDDNHDGNSSNGGNSRSTGSSTSTNTGSTGSGSGKDDEEAAVWRVYSIVCSALSSSASAGGSAEWIEDKSRFKDYITAPKPSGYDPPLLSLSVCLSLSLSLSLPFSVTPFFFSYSFSLSVSLSYFALYLSLSFLHFLPDFPVHVTYSISFYDLSFDMLQLSIPNKAHFFTPLFFSVNTSSPTIIASPHSF